MKKETNVERFNRWMLERVKSIYYSNNELMCNAYSKINE